MRLAKGLEVRMYSQPSYSPHDVASHNRLDDLWVIIYDKIFDLTNYVDEHPGGKKGLFDPQPIR